MTARRGVLGVMAMGGMAWALWSGSAHAENDYEFAKGLLEMEDGGSFEASDLVSRLIKQLSASPKKELQLEAKLIEATQHRRQAQNASAEKRNELLTQADNLYKEFMAAGKDHRLFKTCEMEQATIQKDYARALIKAAEDNPAQANESRMKAVDIYKKSADLLEEDAKKYRPALTDALKKLNDYMDANQDAESIPPNLLNPAQKALEDFISRDKQYVVARMEQVEAYPEGAAKKEAAAALIKYCEALTASEDLGMIDTVAMWYWFIKGRLHSMILEEDKATESWRTALETQPEAADAAAKATILEVRKLIYADLVKMKMRAAEKNPERFGDVIDIVGNAIFEPSMKTFWEQPHGKLLLIDYANALVKQPEAGQNEYEQAIKWLRKIVEGGPPWSINASREMAKLIRLGRNRKPPVHPKLSAEAWFDIARGFFIEGQVEHKRYTENKDGGDAQKAQAAYDLAAEKYSFAVEYYRRAIGQARNPALTTIPVRLKVEPQSWFEMGLSYLKMDHYYEAIIAYQALRTTFGPEYISKWMPDPSKDKKLYADAAVKSALDELNRKSDGDPRNEGLLQKTEKNIVIALGLNAKTATRFNKKLKIEIMKEEDLDLPGGVSDNDYQAGKLQMEDGKDLMEQGSRFAGQKNAKEAEKQYQEAIKRLKDAAVNFEKVQPASKAYEIALYQGATCYTMAQQILATDKITQSLTKEDREAQIKELTAKGLAAYQKYQDHVAKEPDNTEEGIERRKKLDRGALLSRTTLHYGAEDWENVIKSCDEYMAYDAKNPAGEGDPKLLTVLFNKFRALSQIGGIKEPPECDAFLEQAAKLLPKLKEKDTFYIFALQNISQRYHNALARAEKAKLDQDVIAKYDAKIAEYQTIALELKNPDDRTLQEWGNLLYYNEKEGKLKEASDIAQEMLKRFDPENRNKQIGDDDETKEKSIWDTYMSGINSVIANSYSQDRTKALGCRKDHEVLIDYMYETRQGLVNENSPDKRPAYDKFNIDYEKALKQIKTIKQNYADCPTHKPTQEAHQVRGKSYLQTVEDEIEYRRRIIAVRDLLSEIALKVAKEFEKKGDAENAKKYRTVADEQLVVLEEIYGNVPSMKLKSANIKVANEDYEGALQILYKLKNEENDKTSDLYVSVSKRISEVHFLKGEFQDAVDYPQFIGATAGLESNWVKKNWPDMKEFMEQCYVKGAKRPDVVASTTPESAVSYRPKSPDEKELEQLQVVFDQANRDPNMKDRLLTPEFLFKFDFLKGKIAHFAEFQILERTLLTHKGKDNEKQVLDATFMARYAAIEELVKAERDAWRVLQKYDQLIVDKGGIANVPAEDRKVREDAISKVQSLSGKLKDIPLPKAVSEGASKSEAPAKTEAPAKSEEPAKTEAPANP